MIQQRNFWLHILLSILTCGIYTYFFFYGVTKDLNTMDRNSGDHTDPTMVIILSIVTCGIYPIWWWYKMGNRIQNVGYSMNMQISENGTTYLLWILLGSFLCGVGAFVGIYLFIKNLNMIATTYNARMATGMM